MKKTLFIIPTVLLLIGSLFTSCKTEIIENIPQVVSIKATPESLVYGNKITVVAILKDNSVPLYMAKITYTIDSEEVKVDTVRLSKKDETVTKEFNLDLYRNAPDNGKLTITVEVTNSEGGVAASSISDIKVTRPVFNKLYLKFEDNDVLEMTQRITNPNEYECTWVLSNDIRVKVLSNASNPESGIIWGEVNNSFDLSADAQYFQLVDPLILPSKIVFDVNTFNLSFEGTTTDDGNMWIGMTKLTAETGLDPEVYPGITIMTGTGRFTKNGQVNFRGIPSSVDIDKIINPDFFKKTEGKYYFIQETADYTIRYDEYIGFLFVNRADGDYPNGLYIAGWGYGAPTSPYTTARSNYEFDDEILPPGVFYFMPKISEGVYVATIYLEADATEFIGFNFYYQKGWGDPTGSGPGGIAQVSANELAFSSNDALPLNEGAVWRDGVATPFIKGVYSLKVDFKERKLSATLIKAIE